ncbi:MAG: A/G-specific adenine glycosylase [Terriglobia bacterium]
MKIRNGQPPPRHQKPDGDSIRVPKKERLFLQSRLLQWYQRYQRDLPWRGTLDPYRVWISEVMLQQTQVKTVVPYYNHFLATFPNVRTLAKAEIPKLLKSWAGLGYYSRARNLKKAARVILDQHAGRFPKTVEAVHALPGIGRYTAAAILSICFNQPLAVLDGNVMRVLTRIFKITGSIKDSKVQHLLWEIAQAVLDRENPGDFNQALMELGATVCTPRQPKCASCPWEKRCLAKKLGMQESLPEKGKKLVSRETHCAAFLVEYAGKILIVRRSGTGQLQGFWEFPSLEWQGPRLTGAMLAKRFQEKFSLPLRGLKKPAMQLRHSITTRRITMNVYQASLPEAFELPNRGRDSRWVSRTGLAKYPFSSATLKILKRMNLRA